MTWIVHSFSGVSGLEEAAQEIRDLKKQMNVRDRQIEELTLYINKQEVSTQFNNIQSGRLT